MGSHKADFTCLVDLGLFPVMTVSPAFPVCGDLDGFEECWAGVLLTVPQLGFVSCVSRGWGGVRCFGEEGHRGEAPFSPRPMESLWLIPMMLASIPVWVFVRVSTFKAPLPPFQTSPGQERLCTWFGIFLHGRPDSVPFI